LLGIGIKIKSPYKLLVITLMLILVVSILFLVFPFGDVLFLFPTFVMLIVFSIIFGLAWKYESNKQIYQFIWSILYILLSIMSICIIILMLFLSSPVLLKYYAGNYFVIAILIVTIKDIFSIVAVWKKNDFKYRHIFFHSDLWSEITRFTGYMLIIMAIVGVIFVNLQTMIIEMGDPLLFFIIIVIIALLYRQAESKKERAIGIINKIKEMKNNYLKDIGSWEYGAID